MSTLKTNNIEHLDASTPSIQTTIGGGTILAGVSTVSDTLNVGTGITFNTDGSAEFAGNVESTNGTSRVLMNGGVGQLYIKSTTSAAVQIQDTSLNNNILLNTNGTATFAGTVENGNFNSSLDTGKGSKLVVGSTSASINVQHPYTANNTATAIGVYKSPGSGQTPVRTVTIFGDGSAEFAGNITLSTAGTGIDFSATSDGSGSSTSELLDDYETGNWTPVLKSGTNVITVTGTNNYYRYIKVGRLVTLFYCINNATTSGTTGGICSVAGLPFAPSSNTQNNRFISGDVMFFNTGFKIDAWPVYPHTSTGDLFVNFYEKASAGAQYNSANVNTVGSGSYFFFTLSYYTS